ncbi:SLATT domain-containing protein [Flavobacterium rhamnosiphilum]|uniref:SLATT domain-containing protein n=1 Tax=Flavobacterium rhamnosiphilum TaxID=2541724 RepID=A0A4R5FCA7_9FLAO|nr:SLATT domain-containing protein [Flavobacterium rhamnosiphilum]TDE46866.1 SLATT domain-containing protein [Flavobacterium rhamnosiphilum]
MSEQIALLESQIREIYGRVVYTHKTHEKCADVLKERNDCLKITEVILSALTTTSILVLIFGDGIVFQFLAALFSTTLLCLTLYSKDYNLLALAEKHKQAALDILEVREKLLSLLVDIRIGNKNVNDYQLERNKLNEQLVNTYRGAPKTINKAYKIASKALQKNEEFTFSDEEIDKFLPESLRKSN